MIICIKVWIAGHVTNYVGSDPVWATARAAETSEDGDYVIEHIIDGAPGALLRFVRAADGDKYELVPDEEVPDWVWAQLAKRALLGDLTNGE